MAKAIRLLGISKSSIAIILDVISELYEFPEILIYPNMKDSPTPHLPVRTAGYRIDDLRCDLTGESGFFWGTASPDVRQNIFSWFHENHQIQKNQYLNLIHPQAYIAPSAQTRHGVLVEPMSVVSSQSQIGFGVFIKRGALIGHHNNIGSYCDINPGAVLSGNVTVGEGTIIGSGSVVKDNISVGAHSIIGVGSVVTKNLPDHVVAYGNPCRVVRKLETGG